MPRINFSINIITYKKENKDLSQKLNVVLFKTSTELLIYRSNRKNKWSIKRIFNNLKPIVEVISRLKHESRYEGPYKIISTVLFNIGISINQHKTKTNQNI